MIKSHFVMFESHIGIGLDKLSIISLFNEMSSNKHLVILDGTLTKLADKYKYEIEDRSKSEYLFMEDILFNTPHLQVFLYNSEISDIEEYFKQYRTSKLNKVKIDIKDKSDEHTVKIILKKLNNLYKS